MAALQKGLKKQLSLTDHIMRLQSEVDDLRDILAQSDSSLKRFVDQLKQNDLLLFERARRIEELTKQSHTLS